MNQKNASRSCVKVKLVRKSPYLHIRVRVMAVDVELGGKGRTTGLDTNAF